MNNEFEVLDKKKENNALVNADIKEIEELQKKYSAVNPKEIEKKIISKCKYYSTMPQDILEEKFGFENGSKSEFIEGIKDAVTLRIFNYVKPKINKIKKKVEKEQILTRRGQIEKFWEEQPFYYDKSRIFWLWNTNCLHMFESPVA